MGAHRCDAWCIIDDKHRYCSLSGSILSKPFCRRSAQKSLSTPRASEPSHLDDRPMVPAHRTPSRDTPHAVSDKRLFVKEAWLQALLLLETIEARHIQHSPRPCGPVVSMS